MRGRSGCWLDKRNEELCVRYHARHSAAKKTNGANQQKKPFLDRTAGPEGFDPFFTVKEQAMTTPPVTEQSYALVQQYDALWEGSAHRNFCVPIKNGRATIKVDGMPDYQLYFARAGAKSVEANSIFAQGLETAGKIDVDTPDEPHANGYVCLGVAQ
jgi:hypothetical protein